MRNLESQLRKIQDKIKDEVNGKVSARELFDSGFLDKNSDFRTLNEFFAFHDISIDNIDDFNEIDITVLNKATKNSTSFNNWDEMIKKASKEYAVKKLKDAGFNIRK